MNIIDLFSGAGGLTFGFYYNLINDQFIRRNNHFIFANEYDHAAATAFTENFPDIHMENCDIRDLNKDKILNLTKETDDVDIIIGGPPCQSFSTAGQRIYDNKALLYTEYLRILKIVQPKVFLFENVKGILSMKETFYVKDKNGNIQYKTLRNKRTGRESRRPIVDKYGRKVIDIIEESFNDVENGFCYNVTKIILNAVNYGIPENRERVFIIGIRNDLNINFVWNFLELPKVSIEDAISDLPILEENQYIDKYTMPPKNRFQQLMRGSTNTLTQHFCGNYGEKIRTVIANVKQGQGKDDFNQLIDAGIIDEKYRLTSGYRNTYGRLKADQPCTTITNNMCTPSGLRCIHYNQNRALSPREGARIQTFPDWFKFYGTRTDVTKQIGNAVPPLLAIRIANKILDTLGE